MFHVGDTVVLKKIPPGDSAELSLDFVGTILRDAGDGWFGVEWDGMTEGHTLGGLCADGRGWNVCEGYLCRVSPVDPEGAYDVEGIEGLLF